MHIISFLNGHANITHFLIFSKIYFPKALQNYCRFSYKKLTVKSPCKNNSKKLISHSFVRKVCLHFLEVKC